MSLRVEYPWTFLSYCRLSPADHFVQTHSLTELSKLCRGKIAGQMIPETNRCLPQTPHHCLMIISFQKSELWNRISTPVPYILCLLFTVSPSCQSEKGQWPTALGRKCYCLKKYVQCAGGASSTERVLLAGNYPICQLDANYPTCTIAQKLLHLSPAFIKGTNFSLRSHLKFLSDRNWTIHQNQ